MALPLAMTFATAMQRNALAEPAPVLQEIREEVAKILHRPVSTIDVSRPLTAQGAEELDIMEIVLRVEEMYHVNIPDAAFGREAADIGRVMTVEKLARVVGLKQQTPR